MTRKKIAFGIIGLGLMGREFASATARWCHLLTEGPIPEIVGICDPMWATFLQELEGKTEPIFGCFRPEETRLSHALQTAALRSHKYGRVEPVQIE